MTENLADKSTDKSVKVLYIGGYGRSGSTLLVRLLGQLPGFNAVGEMWRIWEKCFIENELCGCGKPFRECSFWSSVVEEAFGGFDGIDVAEVNAIRRLLQSHAYLPVIAFPQLQTEQQRQNTKVYREVVRKLYLAIQHVSGCRVIIDSSKGPRYAMLLNEIPELDLRILHLARDSRAVVYSWQKKMVKPEVYWKTEYMDRPNPLSAALNWNFANLLTQSFEKSRASYRFVRYEDLIESPQRWLAEIAKFAGEDGDTLYGLEGDGSVNLAVNHTAVGNPNRFRQGAIELHRDDEWRYRMPKIQKQLVTSLTLLLLQKYGYLAEQTDTVKSDTLSTKFRTWTRLFDA
jgi:hypothetical protein